MRHPTGLKDINGRMLHDRDICWLNGAIVVVDFVAGAWGVRRKNMDFDAFVTLPRLRDVVANCAILGNLDDSPELLHQDPPKAPAGH